jgi:hypothetical protein
VKAKRATPVPDRAFTVLSSAAMSNLGMQPKQAPTEFVDVYICYDEGTQEDKHLAKLLKHSLKKNQMTCYLAQREASTSSVCPLFLAVSPCLLTVCDVQLRPR